jgi:DUF218 domain
MTIHVLLTCGLDKSSCPLRTQGNIANIHTNFVIGDTVVISGAGTNLRRNQTVIITEAFAASEYIRQYYTIFSSALILEERSFDTVGNAVFTYNLLLERNLLNNKIIIYTSNYHIVRAKYIFDKVFESSLLYVESSITELNSSVQSARIQYEIKELEWLRTQLNKLNGYIEINNWMIANDEAYITNNTKVISNELLESF